MKKKNVFRYYLVGTQISIIVFSAMFIGHQVDLFLENKKHIITIILSVIAILYALCALIKDVNKEK